jgi:hypothetical protein
MRESSSGVTPCAAVSVSACTTKTRARASKLGHAKSAENRVRSWRTTHARRTPLTVTERRADVRRGHESERRDRRCVPGQLCCSMRGRALWRGEETTMTTTMVTVVQRDDNNPAPLLTAHNEAYPSGLLTFARPSVPLRVQYHHHPRAPFPPVPIANQRPYRSLGGAAAPCRHHAFSQDTQGRESYTHPRSYHPRARVMTHMFPCQSDTYMTRMNNSAHTDDRRRSLLAPPCSRA